MQVEAAVSFTDDRLISVMKQHLFKILSGGESPYSVSDSDASNLFHFHCIWAFSVGHINDIFLSKDSMKLIL